MTLISPAASLHGRLRVFPPRVETPMRGFLVLIVQALAAATPLSAQQRTVNVYNWSDYVEPTVIEAFTKETGIKVKYDTFDANETLETKLLAGKSGYDVVVPTAYFLERQI